MLKEYDWRVRPRGQNDTWPGKRNIWLVHTRFLAICRYGRTGGGQREHLSAIDQQNRCRKYGK